MVATARAYEVAREYPEPPSVFKTRLDDRYTLGDIVAFAKWFRAQIPSVAASGGPEKAQFPTSWKHRTSKKWQALISMDDFDEVIYGRTPLIQKVKYLYLSLNLANCVNESYELKLTAIDIQRNRSDKRNDFDTLTQVFTILFDSLSPLIPSRSQIIRQLVGKGLSEEEASRLLIPIDSEIRGRLISQGESCSTSEAKRIMRAACEFARSVALSLKGAQVDLRANVPHDEFAIAADAGGEPLGAWEISRRAKLPERAIPYSEGKKSGETVLEYYERTWGIPYRDKGLLYRDDIRRLGDGNLLTVVADHCRKNGLDVDAILPKKVAQRASDELEAIDPDSARAEKLRKRLSQRASTAKSRTSRSTPKM